MIRVAVRRVPRAVHITERVVGQWVRAVLRGEGIDRADLSVVFVDDRLSRRLHRRWFGQDSTTDVMAFPLETEETLEGEIYVNGARAGRQARRFGVSLREELLRLVIHGTLHVAGYDDTRPGRARKMRQREESLVARFRPRRKKVVRQ